MATQDIVTAADIQKRMESLPPEIQALVYSPQMTEALKKIANTHRLHIDQLGSLETETAFVMLGFTEPGDFVRVLAERLPTDKVTAAALAEEINNELLQKIRESLKKLYPDLPGPGASTRPGVQPGSKLQAPPEPSRPTLKDTLPVQSPSVAPVAQQVTPIAPSLAPQTTPIPTPPPQMPPVQPVKPSTPQPLNEVPRPVVQPAAVKPNPVDDALSTPQTSTTERMNVGVPTAKTESYKTDPYREPIE